MTVDGDLREELIRRRLAGNRRRRQGIPTADRSAPLPLSFGQRRLWLLHQFDPASPEYLVPMAMRLRGDLSPVAVAQAWDAMVARHEILRTRYVDDTQVIDPAGPLEVRTADLSALPEDERLPAAMEIFEREAGTPFALDRDWPLRVWLVTLGPDDHVMITVYHHIAFDGWSLGVIDTEWPALYLGYALGEPDPASGLPDLPIQYADYAAWQRDRLTEGGALDRDLTYWHDRLTGLRPLDLPTDRPRPAVRDWAGAKIEFDVPPWLAERLRKVGRDHQATLFMVLLTAFQTLLSRLTGRRDIAIGTPVAGRTLPELARVIGFTVNTLVIRGTWRGDPAFRDLLAETRASVLDALDHQEVPFERLVDDLEPGRDMSRHPLFQVMFGLHNEESGSGDYGILTAETLLTEGAVAKFDLNLHFEETAHGGLAGVLDYATALFDHTTAERLVDHLNRVLTEVATDPSRPVSAITHTPATVPPLAESPDPTPIPARILRYALAHPQSIAITTEGGSLSYAALVTKAEGLAARLRAEGIGPEDRVAVCLPRGPDLVPALLGVWLAGAAYVPLDPGHPDTRLNMIVTDAGARLMITDADLAARFADFPMLVLDTAGSTEHEPDILASRPAQLVDDLTAMDQVLFPGDPGLAGEGSTSAVNTPSQVVLSGTGARPAPQDLWVTSGAEPGDASRGADPVADSSVPRAVVDLDSSAYVIYTSGSTGAPKGVVVTHRNAARLPTVTEGSFGFTADDVWTCCHSAAFDFSVWEIWGALATGGRVVVVPSDVARAPDELLDLLVAERVTVLSQTPSAFGGLVAAAGRDDRRLADLALRLVVFGGERLGTAALAPWFARFGTGGPRLVNMYGITETTVHVTAHDVTGVEEGEGSRVGLPLADLSAVVVDAYGDPAPPGVAGDLHVGGAGVARGYLGRPGLTAERFVPDPYGPPGSRRYRSGDRARTRVDGTLEFLGRVDDQLALRGHRIEPGEVEAALTRHPAVAGAAVAVHEARLIAYVVLRASAAPQADASRNDVGDLRGHCARSLPPYMIPALFLVVPELPLTPNGKVDRRALPAPETSEPEKAGAPRTRTEALMLAAWTRALGRGGVDEDFFEAGGDSLRAVAVIGELRAAGFDVSVRDLFERRTVARLAALADKRPAAEQQPPVAPFALLLPEDAARLPEGVTDAYPLSQIQAGMVYQSILYPDRQYYHDVVSFSVHDRPFDEPALRAAAEAATARHENLRTSVHLAGYSLPLQLVHAAATLPIEVEDLRALPEKARAAAVEARLTKERETRFDLPAAPLMRLAVQVESDDRWRLWMTLHHVIVEGWSHHQLLMELLTGEGSTEQVAVRHADFVAAELAAIDSVEDQAHWAGVLADHRRWDIPDAWGDPAADGEVDQIHVDLLGAYEGLLRLAATAQVPLKSVLLAAHLKVLAGCTPDTAFHTGLLCDARPEAAGADRVHGMFLNMVPFPFALKGGTWRDLVREVFATEVALWPHRRFPLPEMARRWGDGRELLPVFFNYLDFHMVDAEVVDLGESVGEVPNEFPLMVTTSNGVLTLTTHRRSLSRHHATHLADAYRAVITAMADDPEGDTLIPCFTAEATQSTPPESRGSVPNSILAQVLRTPDAVAVSVAEGGTETVTYTALHERARRVAGLLAAAGAGPEKVVGVRLGRGPDLVAALLGVWYTGAAYLPIDPAWPARRVSDVLTDAGAVALLGDLPTPDVLPDAGAVAVIGDSPTLDDLSDAGAVGPLGESPTWGDLSDAGAVAPLPAWDNLSEASTVFSTSTWGRAQPIDPVEVDLDSLAYVIFTSGSTGRPKGVEVSHRNLSGYIRTAAAKGSAPLISSPAYDMAVTALFVPLVTGERVHILPDRPEDLGKLLADGAPYGFVKLTPSHLEILATTPQQPTTWLIGGETLTTALARRWLAAAPGSVLVNEYGPTEATVACAVHTAINPEELGDGERVPIGRAMPGATVRVVDRWFHAAPQGVPGEVVIGGGGVARGYRGRPALTAERFVPDPDGPPGSRMYRTGDLGRVLESGDLDLIGRTDDQVKIRGHRVEPGETAAVLAAHPAVRAAVAVPVDGHLVAYAVSASPATTPRRPGGWAEAVKEPHFEQTSHAAQSTEADQEEGTSVAREASAGREEELLAWLRERLPAPQIPWRVVMIDAIPVTPGGKLDRAALPSPTPPARIHTVSPETPTEHALAAIWRMIFKRDVSTGDDFFDLGGHSLLMLRAVGLASEQNVGLRAADILELRTLRAIAARVDSRVDSRIDTATSPLFPLNKAEGRPIIAIHPAGGSSHWYLPLAERLKVPVTALAVPDLERAADIAALSDHYLRHLPAGSLRLFAWSSGSVIAWELARRLTAQGRPPERLTLADPMTDIPGSHVGAETFDELERLLADPGTNRLARGLTGYRAQRLLNDLGIAAGRDDLAALAEEIRLWRTLDAATAAYRFTPLPIKVRLVASDDAASGQHSVTGHLPYSDYLTRWRELALRGLTVTRLGSSHRGLFHPPYVDTLARVTSEVNHDDR
ncbi:non-ribosomal peptide synthetase [Herbidospora mongoliensis]|uniref:non-ribosomal peptide synthetase n=1 Tax=Herbidospora mongoliensis TaxID=688067 RepID=UPI00082E68CB|nr:non-ribosomal peptide synthetase [Herbidospora mongoliensis]